MHRKSKLIKIDYIDLSKLKEPQTQYPRIVILKLICISQKNVFSCLNKISLTFIIYKNYPCFEKDAHLSRYHKT